MRSGVIGHFSLWDQSGLGRPNALASVNPLLFMILCVGWIVGPIIGAKVAIAAATVVSALSATYCARRTIVNTALGSMLAGILYGTSPVIFNKIAAGQVTFWYAYALLPLIFERARAAQDGDRRAVLWVALLCALTTIQPQFAAFSLIVIVAATFPFARRRRTLMILMTAAAAMAVALAPTAWALLSARGDILAQYAWPVQTWERMHSTSVRSALLTSQYIIPYYETALHGSPWFAAAAAAAGVLGILTTLRTRDGPALLSLVLLGIAFTTGTVGPLRPLWAWMFANVEPAAFFRELYNANALLSLAYALGAAAATRTALFGRLAACALVIFSAMPIVLGTLGRAVPNVVDNDVSFAAQIAERPPGRILYLPSLAPLVRNGHEPGGVDVLAVGDPMHPPTSEYPPQFPLTTIGIAGGLGDPWWLHLLEKISVVGIVSRPNLHSEIDLNTAGTRSARGWAFNATRSRPIAEFAQRAATQAISFRSFQPGVVGLADAGGSLPEQGVAQRIIVPNASVQTDDPTKDWVPLDRWRSDAPDTANALAQGVITTSRTPLTILMPPGSWWLLASSSTPLILNDGEHTRSVSAPFAQWIPFRSSSGRLTIRSSGDRAAVYRVASGKSTLPRGPFAQGIGVSTTRPWPWIARMQLSRAPEHRALLIFRERFSAGWRVHGARTLWHGMADSYANAFLVDGPNTAISIVYEPQAVFFVLATLTLLAYAATLVAIARIKPA